MKTAVVVVLGVVELALALALALALLLALALTLLLPLALALTVVSRLAWRVATTPVGTMFNMTVPTLGDLGRIETMKGMVDGYK